MNGPLTKTLGESRASTQPISIRKQVEAKDFIAGFIGRLVDEIIEEDLPHGDLMFKYESFIRNKENYILNFYPNSAYLKEGSERDYFSGKQMLIGEVTYVQYLYNSFYHDFVGDLIDDDEEELRSMIPGFVEVTPYKVTIRAYHDECDHCGRKYPCHYEPDEPDEDGYTRKCDLKGDLCDYLCSVCYDYYEEHREFPPYVYNPKDFEWSFE